MIKFMQWLNIILKSKGGINMGEKITHVDVWVAIEEFARSRNLSCSALAKKSGLNSTTFNRSKRTNSLGKPRWPSTHSVAKILAATDTTIEEFIKFIPRH